jgi:hypothetical protein
MEIHNNPEGFRNDRKTLVRRLLELPTTEVRDYPYHAVCAGSRGLRNFALMALISLYRLGPEDNIPSSLEIVDFYSHGGGLYFDSIFLVPKMREVLISFVKNDLVAEYSEEIFITITNHIWFLVSREQEGPKALVVEYLKLFERWYMESDLELSVDNNWYFLREIFRRGHSLVHEHIIHLLVELLKKGFTTIISFYSYVLRYVGDPDQIKYFEEYLPSSEELPGIDNFLKAEIYYSKMEYDKAIAFYENVPEDFPFIGIFRYYKLFWAAKHCFNHSVVCQAFKGFIKVLNELKSIPSRRHLASTLNAWKDQNFEPYKQSSEFLIINKGIQCNFCTRFISPNALYCSKCGEPIKS